MKTLQKGVWAVWAAFAITGSLCAETPLLFDPPPASCVPGSEDWCASGTDQLCLSNPSKMWVSLTPYVWATQVNGDLTVNGVTAPLDIDLSDLWDFLEDGEVKGAFMGHLETGRDNWSLFINGDYVSMDPSVSRRRATIDTGLSMTLLEVGGAIDIYNACEEDPMNSPLRLQMLGGIRYASVDASAILSLPNVNPVVQVNQSEEWVDLFVGSRLQTQLSPNFGAFVRGDIGGFGIGSSSDLTWNIVTGVTTSGICGSDLVLGYRFFDVDQSLNGGSGSPNGFGVDALIHGPVIGLSFQF